jgi:hypothetical protein
MWFHQPFRADEWLLFQFDSPAASSSRALCFGRVYTRDGTLAVTCAQEGLVRVLGVTMSLIIIINPLPCCHSFIHSLCSYLSFE